MTAFVPGIQVIAERVLNSVPEGLLITAFTWIVLRLAGRQNSGTRFAAWFAALAAIAALPFVPSLRVAGSVARAAHAELTLPVSWALAIFVAWSLIATIATARLTAGLWRLRSLRKHATTLTSTSFDPALRETVEKCRAVRSVQICSSSEIRVPMAIGFVRPVILIPEWTLQELSAEELCAVVLHEFAHLRRWDDWTNLAQKLVRTIFFFHPAVLWIERRLSLEREMACDDAVLAETRNPHAYARCLVSLAERTFVRRSIAMAQAAISRAHEMSLRVAQILDLDRPTATKVFRPALAAVAAFAGLCIVMIPGLPRLIAFQDAPRTIVASGPAGRLTRDDLPQLPKSMVVPALAHVDRLASVPAKEIENARRPAVHSNRVQPVMAKHRPPEREREPVAVQASLKRAAPAQEYIVVMQSVSYSGSGHGVVSLTVWRITATQGGAAQASKAAKQT